MASVEVRNLRLRYGTTQALDDVSLSFPDGQFFGLLGPSGSGKTTLLRCIAGFARPQSGQVLIDGGSVEEIAVERREIGMMFQSYALFPNMSVADNIGFGLKVRKVQPGELKRRVNEALELVQLSHTAERRPQQLSGGQRQRVALARAIVTRPRVLLLDEPLSALDKALRVEMRAELKRIQREVGITTIFVTHDQEEALSLSDQIGILKDGRLVQHGSPQELYNAPENRFAATFLGDANIFEGLPEPSGLRLPTGILLPWPTSDSKQTRYLALRPEVISILRAMPQENVGNPVLQGTLRSKQFSGSLITTIVDTDSSTVKVVGLSTGGSGLSEGDKVWLTWPLKSSMPVGE
jgi:putative spermidine/putrescine transport system ATP-binding protein